MEDYDKFVQLRLSNLRKKTEENNRPSSAPSLIHFYGQPILPPLLSREQREEMHRHRDEAQKAAVHRKMKDDTRMAYVQTILQSVQLRKTPTLEELLQESDINTKSPLSHNASDVSVSQSRNILGTKNTLPSPLPETKGNYVFSFPPLTSTTCSAVITSNVTPQEFYPEQCLIDKHYSQQGSQPNSLNVANHQSVSSGYLSYENVDNATSEGKNAGGDSHGFGSSEGVSSIGGFFLHDTSNTVAKMPDIISHPPIDGEELERSGLELSFCYDFLVTKDISCSSIPEDSIECGHSPVEKGSHMESTESGDNLPVTTVLDLDKDHSLERIESLISSSENSSVLDNPQSPKTLSTSHCSAKEQHIQPDPSETESASNNVDEAQPSEEPYHLSLQALLKKSQEYRRRQRMLRNQAKNTTSNETTQEQTRARTEERSLSDKENDEFPYKGTVTAEGRKTKERRGTSMPLAQTSTKKSWVDQRMIESESFGNKKHLKSGGTYLIVNENVEEIANVEEETTLTNNQLNISQAAITEAKQISPIPHQQDMVTEALPEDFYLRTYSTAFHKGVRKYKTIPAPTFCRSPVRCRSKGSSDDGEVSNEQETSKIKVCVNMGLNKDHKFEEVNQESQNGQNVVPSIENLMVEVAVTRVSATGSQHIDQLESSLSSLKVLISDLGSTLTENLGNQNQTVCNTESDFSFEGVKHLEHVHLCQSDSVCSEDKMRRGTNDNDVDQDQRYREGQRRQSLDNFKNTHEDAGHQPNITDPDNVPLTVQLKETEAVNLNELMLVKTLTADGAEGDGTCKEIRNKSNGRQDGYRKQQPPTKCILSMAQRLRIPEVFRNMPSDNTASRNASVLLDTSNHQDERRPETAVEGRYSPALSSLKQSYDIDAPSGLWFLDGTGPDAGLKGNLILEKHLTPESCGEGQGEVSKIKRRLLMQGMEETADVGRRRDSTVGPNSSTPRGVWWQEGHGGQKDKQEQLKKAQAAQIRALQEEHRRQEEELLQALAAPYHLLQSMSLPCSMSSSHLGDTVTFSQPSNSMLERCRPLLLAVVKGFLTRRLLKTERVAQLVCTIRDTQQFLQALQQQSPGRGDSCSRQDLLLQERSTLQLRAARCEVNSIFFSLTAGEKMQLISWDRELVRERERKRQSGHTGQPRGKSCLSAATLKSLERKREMMMQKKAVERHRGVVTRAGRCTKQTPETKRGQFRINPQRVPKSTYSCRP